MESTRLDLGSLLKVFPREFLDLTLEQQKTSLQLYRLLAEGRPVSHDRLARALDLPIQRVETTLRQWPGVYEDDAGSIVGYWGLALSETDHRFEVGGQRLYTWCAWDSLWIPELLQTTARVESTCPATGSKIRLTVTPQGIEQLDQAQAVMSFVAPDSSKVRENPILHFCHYVYFFSSLEIGERWLTEHPGTFLLSMEEAFELGRKKNTVQYKDVLKSIPVEETRRQHR